MTALADFLSQHRDAIVRRWVEAVRRDNPAHRALTEREVLNSMHLFVDELIATLRAGQGPLLDSRTSSALAEEHGSQRQVLGQTGLADLVREYGVFLDATLAEARERGVALTVDDVAVLHRCLTTGAADAARRFALDRERERRRADFEHMAFLAHELRDPLTSVRLAWDALADSVPGLPSRTAALLGKNLDRLVALIDHALADVRLRAVDLGVELRREPIAIDELLRSIVDEAETNAEARQLGLTIEPSDLTVVGDARLLRSAITNVVRNAIKFSRPGTAVRCRSRAEADRVVVEVADGCGGIDPVDAERMFAAFTQVGRDRSGFGLGLAIAKQAVELHRGTITVADDAPVGCIVLIDLPSGSARPNPSPAGADLD